MAETSDVIIIGGGIHGASLAFHLTRRGLRPLVLERRFVAAGATGRSSGLVRMHYDLEPESALAWSSYQLFRDWSEIVGGECGFTRTGFLQFVAADHAPQLRANVAMHQRLGIPSLVVTNFDNEMLGFYRASKGGMYVDQAPSSEIGRRSRGSSSRQRA